MLEEVEEVQVMEFNQEELEVVELDNIQEELLLQVQLILEVEEVRVLIAEVEQPEDQESLL